ncbi:conserved membrane hypothetical protein [Candidatus Sulfopaludibacter sp. SbA3]|nr:conserved membrane hypothetical protein [Candidatus Sulfopaludibacter sp. SbA3]
MDNLRYIRGTMERAGSFTAVPGLGGVLMGSTALVAAWLATSVRGSGHWIGIWTVECAVGVLIGLIGATMKARRMRSPLLNGPGRKFLAGFAPAIFAGAILTIVFRDEGMLWFLPGIWLLLYGTAVLSAGWGSVRVVPLMGLCFMITGTVSLLLPELPGNILLAAGFGGLHIVFGTIIAVKHGG